MKKFDYMSKYGYEQLSFFYDKSTGLKAITCIHNTVLGPSLGGTRFLDYADEEDAVEDVLRLARGMTYKSACAGINLGGGKTVILGDAEALRKDSVKREAFWRAFGRYIEGLNGRYITAEDVNTTTSDMDYIAMETNFVVGIASKSGNPSPFTARGVLKAIKACIKEVYGEGDLAGKVVAIQGLGSVGFDLARKLHEEGAKLYVTTRDKAKIQMAVEELGVTAVELDEIYDVECDVYCPCALGATVNDDTINRLKCKIIAGAANNVLKDAPVHGQILFDKSIVYAPDYVVNAGGVINVYQEILGYDEADAVRKIDLIYDRVREIVRISNETKTPTYLIADKMAEARIEAVKNIKGIYNR